MDLVANLDYVGGLTTVQLNDVVNAANKFYDHSPANLRLTRPTFEDYLIDADYWVKYMIDAHRPRLAKS